MLQFYYSWFQIVDNVSENYFIKLNTFQNKNNEESDIPKFPKIENCGLFDIFIFFDISILKFDAMFTF